MSGINELVLLSELASEDVRCELNHGPGTNDEFYPAVCFIVLPIGQNEGNDIYKQEHELTISVCKECSEALQEDEWTLLFCVTCTSSQWIARQQSKMRYRHHIVWLQGCPECTNEFGGIYFSDDHNQ